MIVEAIRAAAQGESFISAELDLALNAGDIGGAPKLSAQERRVMALYGGGEPVKSVAYELGISEETAKSYLKRIREKYRVAGHRRRHQGRAAEARDPGRHPDPGRAERQLLVTDELRIRPDRIDDRGDRPEEQHDVQHVARRQHEQQGEVGLALQAAASTGTGRWPACSPAITSASTTGTRNDGPRPVSDAVSPKTIGTASQVTNCGEPTLLNRMSAVVIARASGGSRSAAGDAAPDRDARRARSRTAVDDRQQRGHDVRGRSPIPGRRTW